MKRRRRSRQNQSKSFFELLLDVLIQLPWWFNLALTTIAYILLTYYVPTIEFRNPIIKGLAPVLFTFAWIFPLIFILAALISAIKSWKKGTLFKKNYSSNYIQNPPSDNYKPWEQKYSVDDNTNSFPNNYQKSILPKKQPTNNHQKNDIGEDIRNLSWQNFEYLIARIYESKGYNIVSQNRSRDPEPDGGVDVRLEKAGKKILVQCKKWSVKRKVGVKPVRELLGVMTAEEADSSIMVTSGYYTQAAKDFATKTSIRLIDIDDLIKLASPEIMDAVRKISSDRTERQKESPLCPKCDARMLERIAKSGKKRGNVFLGCIRYPKCNGIININD